MSFKDRMFQASEEVYDRIVSGEIQGPGQVEAALLDAQVQASTSEEDDD